MVKKVLPPLNEQNQIPNIASSGEWKSEDATGDTLWEAPKRREH